MQLATITLPDDLIWQDEFQWAAPIHTLSYTITGAMRLDAGVRQAGRPVTLTGSETAGWVSKTTLDSLYTLVNAVPAAMTLILPDARQFQVMFRHHETALEAHPVIDYNTAGATDWYWLILRLMTV